MQLAYEKVDSEDVNFFNTNKLGIAHAYLQLSSSVKRSANAYNFVMDVRKIGSILIIIWTEGIEQNKDC